MKMVKVSACLMALSYTLAVQAQSKSTAGAVPMSSAGIPMASDRAITDTLKGYSWTNGAAAGPTLILSANGGYVAGNNWYGDKQKVQVFNNTLGGLNVYGALIWFGAKQKDGFSTSGSKVIVKEYTLNGAGSSNSGSVMTAPGTLNASVDLLFSAVDTGSTYATGINTVLFPSHVYSGGNFGIGVDFSTLAAGDTLGMVTSTQGDAGLTDAAWEQANDNSWHTLMQSWPLNIDYFIWALVEHDASGVEEQGFVNGARLLNCFPNPANTMTEIGFELQQDETAVNIVVLDASGKLVENIDLGRQTAGKHYFQLETGKYSSGLYYFALSAGKARIADKFVISK